MEFYYKLLDLIEGKYTTHETYEELRHYIMHRVSDMQYDYKFTDRLILTGHPNYNFHYVIVEDDNEFREFVYFFDTIEEELDSREDNEDEFKKQHANLVNLLNEKITELFNANRTIEFLRKQIYDLECEIDNSKRSEKARLGSIYGMTVSETEAYYKEMLKSKEHRIEVLEAGIKESERNEQFWKSQHEKYKKFVDAMHKQSADFMHGCDDDFPF